MSVAGTGRPRFARPGSLRDGGRIGTIEALRGLAALAVCGFHLTNGNPGFLEDGPVKAAGSLGWLGVEVFFVISGCVIPCALFAGGYRLRDAGRFLLRRILRLDPPYLASIVLCLALAWLASRTAAYAGGPFAISPASLGAHVAYLNAFLGYPWVNPVYWSLAVEFQYYLAIALLYPLVGAESAGTRRCALAGLLALSFAEQGGALVVGYLALFACGIAAFHHRAGRAGAGETLAWMAAAAGALGLQKGALVAATCAGTGVAVAFVDFDGRWLVRLGGISYSLYLLHVPVGGRVINLGARLGGGAWTKGAVLLAALAACLAAAALFARAVEGPSRRWSARVGYGGERRTSGTDGQRLHP